jgi:hypothetical protein
MRQKTKCTKFVGALTVELLRKEFLKLGLNLSNRDVFIRGIPSELDLLVAKTGNYPEENLVYDADQVLAVFEIKFRGSYGKSTVDEIKDVFDSIKRLNRHIECFYVSISENKRYKYRITEDNLGYDCFELFTRDTNLESALKREQLRLTGDWQRLVQRLQQLSRRVL